MVIYHGMIVTKIHHLKPIHPSIQWEKHNKKHETNGWYSSLGSILPKKKCHEPGGFCFVYFYFLGGGGEKICTPPKFNDSNLKMMVSKAGLSFSRDFFSDFMSNFWGVRIHFWRCDEMPQDAIHLHERATKKPPGSRILSNRDPYNSS